MFCFAVLPFRAVPVGQSVRVVTIRASMVVCPQSILFPSNS